MGKILLTKRGAEELREKLKKLESKYEEISRTKTEVAVQCGDLWHDNPAFEDLEMQQNVLMRQIEEVKKFLKSAVVDEGSDSRGALRVNLGSRVEIEFEDGSVKEIIVCDPVSSDPNNGKISYLSPLGKVIMGAAVGELRTYRAGGGSKEVSIKKIF